MGGCGKRCVPPIGSSKPKLLVSNRRLKYGVVRGEELLYEPHALCNVFFTM